MKNYIHDLEQRFMMDGSLWAVYYEQMDQILFEELRAAHYPFMVHKDRFIIFHPDLQIQEDEFKKELIEEFLDEHTEFQISIKTLENYCDYVVITEEGLMCTIPLFNQELRNLVGFYNIVQTIFQYRLQ